MIAQITVDRTCHLTPKEKAIIREMINRNIMQAKSGKKTIELTDCGQGAWTSKILEPYTNDYGVRKERFHRAFFTVKYMSHRTITIETQ